MPRKVIPAHFSLIGVFLIANALLSAEVPSAPSVAGGFDKALLNFEPNQGQAPAGVDAVAHGPGYRLLLKKGEAAIQFAPLDGAAGGEIQLRLLGADPKAVFQPEERQVGTTSYFLGKDRAAWHTDVPNYARVRYSGVYSGIDVVYYANDRRLEHDFVVAPGADAAQIRRILITSRPRFSRRTEERSCRGACDMFWIT